MSLFYPLKRTTLHIPNTGPAHDPTRGHLYFVMNDPCSNRKNLLVGLNTFYDRCDKSCILMDGHKFINRKSFILYAEADIVDTAVLIKSVNAKTVAYEGLVDEGQFESIKAGFLTSPHCTPKIKAYFKANCM